MQLDIADYAKTKELADLKGIKVNQFVRMVLLEKLQSLTDKQD